MNVVEDTERSVLQSEGYFNQDSVFHAQYLKSVIICKST